MYQITLNGKQYPVRLTMGAMLRFKRATGKEVQEIGEDLEQVITFMHCCIASACKADGIPFDLSVDELADHLSASDVTTFTQQLMAEPSDGVAQEAADGSKKK